MPGFSPVLKELVINGILLARMRPRPANKVGLSLYGFSAVLAMAGMVYLIYSGYLALQIVLNPVEAALAAALASFALACVTSLIARAVIKRRRAEQVNQQSDLSQVIHSLIEVFEQEFGEPIRDNPKMALMAASIAGLFAGRQIH
jgi:hypothetical protein